MTTDKDTSKHRSTTSGKNSPDSNTSSADAKLKGKAKHDAEEIKTKAKQEGEKLKQEATSTARSRIEEGSGRAAEEVDHAADTVEAVASALDDQHVEGLASYAHDMSSQMSEFASSLSDKSADELVQDAQRLARNNPAVFLAGSVALGFGLARFFKASQSEPRHDYDSADRDYDPNNRNYASGRPIPRPTTTTARRGTRITRPTGVNTSASSSRDQSTSAYSSNGANRSSS